MRSALNGVVRVDMWGCLPHCPWWCGELLAAQRSMHGNGLLPS
jgi:hypothetical protein